MRTCSDKLREHMRRAGLTRDELYADDDERRQHSFHDLRHGYATHLALAGHDVMTIKGRGGWADLTTLQRYVAEAETVGRGDVGAP